MIEAIKNGNVDAFEEAFVLYRNKLFAYFLKKTRSEEDAKDLTQSTFTKLWQYRKSLCEEYLFEQHLFHIARTVFIDYLRKENKQQKIKASMHLKTIELVEPDLAFDTYKTVHTTLSEMPATRRRVFELHKIEGYSYKEIATILSISVKSVDNNLAKALKHLRSIKMPIIVCILCLFH